MESVLTTGVLRRERERERDELMVSIRKVCRLALKGRISKRNE
jgi:hypothetical protein